MKPSKIFFYLFRTKLIYILISLIILTITVQIVDFIELTQSHINDENISIINFDDYDRSIKYNYSWESNKKPKI